MKKLTYKELERKLREAEASQAHNYYFAQKELEKLSTERLMGSGVILSLTVLGGGERIKPVLISDGLSKETITAIKADLKRSFDTATLFKPE